MSIRRNFMLKRPPDLLPVTHTCALNYNGTISWSFTGRTCQRWDAIDPSVLDPVDFPDNFIREAENYCRNPDDKGSGPWCFVANDASEITWESCGIDPCLSKSGGGQNRR